MVAREPDSVALEELAPEVALEDLVTEAIEVEIAEVVALLEVVVEPGWADVPVAAPTKRLVP